VILTRNLPVRGPSGLPAAGRARWIGLPRGLHQTVMHAGRPEILRSRSLGIAQWNSADGDPLMGTEAVFGMSYSAGWTSGPSR
jgi:hypothetical protein